MITGHRHHQSSAVRHDVSLRPPQQEARVAGLLNEVREWHEQAHEGHAARQICAVTPVLLACAGVMMPHDPAHISQPLLDVVD